MLTIVLGRSGSGKSFFLKNELKEYLSSRKDGPKAVFLVPEQYTLETERELLELFGNRLFAGCDVLSFRRLAHRVFSETGDDPNKYLENAGKLLIASKASKACAKNLRVYGNIAKRPAFAKQILSLRKEFKNQMITPSKLEGAYGELSDEFLKEKLFDISMIFNEMEKIEEGSFKDADDDLSRLFEALCAHPEIFKGRKVFVDGFFGFDEREFLVLRELFKRSDVTLALCSSDKTEDDYLEAAFMTHKKLLRSADSEGVEVKVQNLSGNKRTSIPELLFLEENFLSHSQKTFEACAERISLYEAENPFDEVEKAALRILRLVREEHYAFRDFAILTGDFSCYIEIIRAVFMKYDIPFFADRTDDILSKGVIAATLFALSLFMGKRSYKDMFAFLKTPFSGLSNDEISLLENYVVTWDIKYADWDDETWEYAFSGPGKITRDGDKELLEKINLLKARIMAPFRKFEDRFSKKQSGEEFCRALYEFLEEERFPELLKAEAEEAFKKGDFESSSENSRLWSILIEVLDLIAEIYKEEEISLTEFVEILKLSVAECDMGFIPSTMDQVTVGKIERARTPNIKCVMIIGANEGSFPRFEVDETIFSDQEKEDLNEQGFLFQTTYERETKRELFNIYSSVSSAEERICFSYSLSDSKGKAKRPGYLIARLKSMFPLLSTNLSEKKEAKIQSPAQFLDIVLSARRENADEWDKRAGENLIHSGIVKDIPKRKLPEEIKNKDLLQELYGEKLSVSATRIEKFNSCKFSYFAEYGLNARIIERTVFNPAHAGVMVHGVLERFMREMRERNLSFQVITEREINLLTDFAVREHIEQTLGKNKMATKRTSYIFRRLTSALKIIIKRLCDEFKESDFLPLDFELVVGDKENGIEEFTFNTPEGIIVRTRGIIDRVDGYEQDGQLYLRVVDYKTGNKEFSLNRILNGLDIQLLLYLFALSDNGEKRYHKKIKQGGALYFPAREITIRSDERLTDEKIVSLREKELRMNGVLCENSDVLYAMDKTCEGKSKFIPAEYSKTGELDKKKSDVLSEEEFGVLRGYVEEILGKAAKEIYDGCVKTDPYRDGRFSICDVCKFKSACLFDETNGSSYRRLKKLSNEELWKEFKGDKDE